MADFDVERTERCLTLTRRPEAGQQWHGCGLAAGAALLVSLLGVFALMRAAGATDPRVTNYLVALWVAGLVLIAVLIPAYAVRDLMHPAVIRFDRESGEMTHRGRIVALLRRIEKVCVRRNLDSDRRSVFTLAIVHTDGCEHPLERSYDEAAIWILGHEIADFLDVDVVP